MAQCGTINVKELKRMLSYPLTQELIESLQNLEGQISTAYAKLLTLPAEEKASIHRYARISMIGASTRIENAQLTDSEIDWLDTVLTNDGKTTALEANRDLIENKLSKDRERSIEEVAGCRQMLLSIYENPKDFSPLRESDLRGLHYQLMSPYKGAGPNIGQYKVQTNSVVEHNRLTGQTRTVFQTADAGVITSSAMADLVSWYNETLPLERWPLAVSCEFVFRFLAIHPFQDGNGRLGRGLMLLSILQSSQPILSNIARYLSIDRQIEKHKEEYYFVLNRCSNGKFSQNPSEYKIGYFLRFMFKIIAEAVADIEIYQNKYRKEQTLSPSATRVLSCFRDNPETRLTTKLIIEMTDLPRRTVGNALSDLLQSGLIQKYGQGAGVRYQITF
jgi:Fic family protein